MIFAVIFATTPCPVCNRYTRAAGDLSATLPPELVGQVDHPADFTPPPICWPCFRDAMAHDLATLHRHQKARAKSYEILFRRAVSAG